jgi:AcrR family transcriptional regulator
MPETTNANKATRAYRSPRREEQARRTRERIIRAARESFLRSGYTTTTMREIATAAGVAVQTVELAFGTKRELLKAVIDVAITGDDLPIPVLQRQQATAAESTTDVGAFLAIVGHVVRIVAERVAGLFVVVDEAASTDPEIAALARELDAQRATTAAWIVQGITERAPLRADLSHGNAVDTIWLLMDPAIFRRLTRDRGWSVDDFQHWFTSSIQRLLLPTGEPHLGGGPSRRSGTATRWWRGPSPIRWRRWARSTRRPSRAWSESPSPTEATARVATGRATAAEDGGTRMVRMFLNGGAMSGGPLHGHLRGAPLLARVRTAPRYRFYSVRDEFPGLSPAGAGGDGVAVEGELYELPEELLRDSLLPHEPPELELGLIELEDGSAAFAMLLRDVARQGGEVADISGFGGWRAYLDHRRATAGG